MPLEIDTIEQAGALAMEKFVADSRRLDVAWREGKLETLLTEMREREIREHSDSGTTEPA